MTSPFIPRFQQLTQPQAQAPLQRALPALPTPIITGGSGNKRYNPFLAAMNNDSDEFKEMYGVNKPLSKPMFVGYKNDKAVYAGSRLFILY